MGDDLTKSPTPLIIIRVLWLFFHLGGWEAAVVGLVVDRRMGMRVSVYLVVDEDYQVLVESTPGKGRAPVLIQGVTRQNVVDRVRPVIDQLRRPRGEPVELP